MKTITVVCPICLNTDVKCDCCDNGFIKVPEDKRKSDKLLNLDHDVLKVILSNWKPMEEVTEHGCADPSSSFGWEIDGICPDCDEPTVDGVAARGCNYSPSCCSTCGYSYCDSSC